MVFRIVPFVYEVESTDRRTRHYRRHHALGTTPVDIPVMDRVPEPTYVAWLPSGDIVNWYEVDGRLLRPVRFRNDVAGTEEIFEEAFLVPLKWVRFSFFSDHPAAQFKVTRQPYRDAHYAVQTLFGEHFIRWSNLAERTVAATELYARCRLLGDSLLAPAKPPTYQVTRRDARARYTIDFGIERGGLLKDMPSFHFGPRDFDLAKRMAIALGAEGIDDEDYVDAIEYDGPSSIHDGSLATARSLAPHVLKIYSRLSPGALGPAELMTYAGLRDLHIGDGDDETATAVLNGVIDGKWPVRSRLDMRSIIDALIVRRDLLAERYDPPELLHFSRS